MFHECHVRLYVVLVKLKLLDAKTRIPDPEHQ